MGKYDVLDFLEKHPNEWFSVREVAVGLGVGKNSVNCSLENLRKSNLVLHKKEVRALSNRDNYDLLVHKHKEKKVKR